MFNIFLYTFFTLAFMLLLPLGVGTFFATLKDLILRLVFFIKLWGYKFSKGVEIKMKNLHMLVIEYTLYKVQTIQYIRGRAYSSTQSDLIVSPG